MIKTTITLILTCAVAFFAHAGSYNTYGKKALNLLTAVSKGCSGKFDKAMKGAKRVGSASSATGRMGNTYTITTVDSGGSKVATLTITQKPNRSKYKCKLSMHSKASRTRAYDGGARDKDYGMDMEDDYSGGGFDDMGY